MNAIALIPTDVNRNWLGLSARLNEKLGDDNVLQHTVRRAAAVRQVNKIVLVHPKDQDPMPLLENRKFDKPVSAFPVNGSLSNVNMQHWIAARKWALANWRGGLGNACCYDEILPTNPLVEALHANHGEAAFIIRCDWCLFDVDYAQEQLAMHLKHPDAYKLTFTQAPPGLSGIATSLTVLEQIAENNGSFAQILGYNPYKPVIDPIGREPNHPIPPSVRDCYRRFIYDTPRSVKLIRDMAKHMGESFKTACATDVTNACREVEANAPRNGLSRLPQQVTLELTPRRLVSGYIVPHHHVKFDRPDIELDLARRLLEQLGDEHAGGDIALLIGGLGDPLLHAKWEEIIRYAHESGVFSIGVETDLLCEETTLRKLLELPIDLLSMRLNADTGETYRQVMGNDAFGQIVHNMQWLFEERNRRSLAGQSCASMPWFVPRLIKTNETLNDLESFFERWARLYAHPVIEPAKSGCGLMPTLTPVPMEPARRRPCRQLKQRMTILSTGQVALCDQDWLGRAVLGDANKQRLIDIWQNVQTIYEQHLDGRYTELPLCKNCSEWHRP